MPLVTNASQEPRIPYSSCPLCGSQGFSKLREDRCTAHPLYRSILPPTIVWMSCDGCKHVFTDGTFTEAQERELFQRANASQVVGHGFETKRSVDAATVSFIAEFRPPHQMKRSWLDVGFGDASLLMTAEEFGYIVTGLETRAENVSAANAIGITAYDTRLEALGGKEYDVISMCDVLEHMRDPLAALRAARRQIKDVGLLYVSCPSYLCPAWRLLDRAGTNPYWQELEHFHNFSRERLMWAMRLTGWMPASYHVSPRYRLGMGIVAFAA